MQTRILPRHFGNLLPPTLPCLDGPDFKHSNWNASLPMSDKTRCSSSWVTTNILNHTVGEPFLNFVIVWIPYLTRAIIRFSVAATHVIPRSYIRDPLVIADIERREERCRQSGGIGTLVIIIQCGSTSQVMPVEVDSPANLTWDSRDDWANVLSHFVESGRTDFKPISTTPTGSVCSNFIPKKRKCLSWFLGFTTDELFFLMS